MKTLLALIVGSTIAVNSVHSALLDLGAVTRDTDSGLDWLDLTLTTGLSVDDILAGAQGRVTNGWRHATKPELERLYRTAGIFRFDIGFWNENTAGVTLLYTLMGITDEPSGAPSAWGFYNGDYGLGTLARLWGSPGGPALVFLAANTNSGPAGQGLPTSTAGPRYGHYLVRSSSFFIEIVHAPQSQRVSLGTDVTFAVDASSSQALTYQWQFSGTNLPGATNATLLLTNATYIQAGIYTVVVESSGGSVAVRSATLQFDFFSLKMYAGLTFDAPTGTQFRVEYLDSIEPTNQWTALTNLTLPTRPYLFIDEASGMLPRRFYRAVLLP